MAKRVLVVTFKPAVEDAWQTDLESHVDFDGWQYLSRNSDRDPTTIKARQPVVYFGSFQDLLGRDAAGNIKPSKRKSTERIDLIVALVMAIGRAQTAEPVRESVYQHRGVLTL